MTFEEQVDSQSDATNRENRIASSLVEETPINVSERVKRDLLKADSATEDKDANDPRFELISDAESKLRADSDLSPASDDYLATMDP